MRRNVLMFLAVVGVLGFVACEDDDDDSNQYSANLTGGAERPTAVTTTATGTFSVTDNGGSNITYLLNVNGLPQVASGAHIHVAPTRAGSLTLPAPADTSGGVVVNLNPAVNCQTCVLAQGTIVASQLSTGVSFDSVRALLNSGRAYVNVHTAANPGGHIRGNITRN